MTKQTFNSNKHKQILISLLIDISKRLKDKIAFKGGTAAMLFYDLRRMSLDLDFDILESLTPEEIDKKDHLLRELEELESNLERDMEDIGKSTDLHR